MSDLKEWRHIANHSTSGDMVWNILMDWQKSEDALRKQLDIVVDKITVTLIHLKRFDNVSDYHYCIDLAKITLDNALAEIKKVGKNE